MMAISRKIVMTASIIYLLALSILAAYALHSSHRFSLPIADVVSAYAIALPPLAGIALEIVLTLHARLAAKGQLQTSRVFQVTIAFFLVSEAVLATLAGVHLSPPGSLTCALKERWMQMYSQKEEKEIRRIQDAFQCCGFNSVKDMAWPFPVNGRGADACVLRYEERTSRCLEGWRGEERRVATMLMVVAVGVFLWMVAIVLAPSSKSGWLPSQIKLPDDGSITDENGNAARPTRPALGYRDIEDVGDENEDSVRGEVRRLNKDSRMASYIEGNRSKLSIDHARWRDLEE